MIARGRPRAFSLTFERCRGMSKEIGGYAIFRGPWVPTPGASTFSDHDFCKVRATSWLVLLFIWIAFRPDAGWWHSKLARYGCLHASRDRATVAHGKNCAVRNPKLAGDLVERAADSLKLIFRPEMAFFGRWHWKISFRDSRHSTFGHGQSSMEFPATI